MSLTTTGLAKLPSSELHYSVTQYFETNFPPERQPHLVIFNEGTAKAVALSVYHKIHGFFPRDGTYAITLDESTRLHPAIVFKSELPVGFNNAIDETVPAMSGIAVHVVDLYYYTEPDMKRFVRRELLVHEGDRVMDNTHFKTHRFYDKIMQKIAWLDSVQPKKID